MAEPKLERGMLCHVGGSDGPLAMVLGPTHPTHWSVEPDRKIPVYRIRYLRPPPTAEQFAEEGVLFPCDLSQRAQTLLSSLFGSRP